MGEQKSPRITKEDLKPHFRYVYRQQKQKVETRWSAFKHKQFERLMAPLPFVIVDRRDKEAYRKWLVKQLTEDPESWVSAQDLFLPDVFGNQNWSRPPVTNDQPGPSGIRPADRGDVPLPSNRIWIGGKWR